MRTHRRSFTVCALVSAALGLVAEAGPVMASWAPPGSGSASSRARTMPAGNTPSASVSGRNVTVSWSASSFSGGGQVSGYTVRRYNTSGVQQTIGSACSGTISALTCTEQGIASGTWKYSVLPLQGNWQGAESAQSTAVTVGSPTLSFSGSTTLSSLPATLSGTLTNYVAGQTVTFRLDNATTGQVLSGSITPTPVASNGQASVSVTIPSGTANGIHTVYAVGSGADTASAGITVAVPTTITTTAWDLRDASSGTESNQSSVSAFASDGRTGTTGFFATTFSSTRYIQSDYDVALPSGRTVSSPSFNFRFAESAANRTACFYFDVRRISTGAVLATHGSTSSPIGCNSTTTQQTFTTAVPEVATSDIANDLRVRVFATESNNRGIVVDLATVSGSTPQTAFTLYDMVDVDSATGTPATIPWPIAAAGDGANYVSAAAWPTAFTTTKYLKFTFPSYVPTTATLNSVSFKHSYRPNTTGNTCYYFEVYSGATLLATHGSSATPVSCNSTTSFVTDTVSLPEVTTPARANGLIVKVYVRNASTLSSQDDLDSLTLNYTD